MENKHQILKDIQKLEEKYNLLKSEGVLLKSEEAKIISIIKENNKRYEEINNELAEIEKEYVDKMQKLL